MPILYSPQLSMKDGSLVKSDYIFDFTPYHLLPHYLFEVITDPNDPEYQYYQYLGETISTPVVGNEEPVPILIKALKNALVIRIEMMDEESMLAERVLMEGEVLFISVELLEDSPLRVWASEDQTGLEGCWYGVTDNGNKYYREMVSGH